MPILLQKSKIERRRKSRQGGFRAAWASTIEREIDNAMPTPPGFVV
jgi:hypothetical protein